MVFSSSIFLFGFFPLLLSLYYFLNIKGKNILLIIFSLIFYAWGEPKYCLIMLFVVFMDYIFAYLIDNNRKYRKIILMIAILGNIGILGYFKYTGFFMTNVSNLFHLNLTIPLIELPIGISFFTFQAMSYVIDVYRRDVKVQKNPFYVLLYVSLFPQLVAGPIVRYKTVEDEILNRKIRMTDISYGLERFIIGLFKKIVIANQVGALADTVFEFKELGSLMILLGSIAYMLQIYFDFSAYSDMAIGMGRMLGFHFEENFNYPYISRSITEFWRRWHISLSTWFRDYVYIPLGGNRKGKRRQIFNLFIVWALTGIWHGASWNFLLWGLYYFFMLVLEKYFLKKYLENIPKVFQHIYVLFIVLIGWILFRSESLHECYYLIIHLFDFRFDYVSSGYFMGLLFKYGIYMFLGILFSMPIYLKVRDFIVYHKSAFINTGLYYALLFCIYYVSVLYLINSTYNPFIYFRF